MNKKFSASLLLAVLLLSVTGAESQDSAAPPPRILPEPKAPDTFQLLDHDGKPFDRERLKGKWSLICFGYTHCPDICPTALAILQAVFRKLEKRPEISRDLQGVFISVDPKHDTPELLKEYVTYFNPAFLGVTGDARELKALSGQMGARYSIAYSWESTGEMDYLVDHSAALYLVDPQARLYAAFKPPYGPEEVSGKLVEILKSHD